MPKIKSTSFVPLAEHRWAKWRIMRLSLFHPRFSQRPYWLYLLTSLSQKWTRSYLITETHTHARVMHNALCCSRFSVPPPPHAQSVPGYQTWQCQLGSWQQPSREEEKERESKREREMETQQDNVKKGCRGGGGGRRGLQRSGVCSVPRWSKTCCRTVPVGFFWDGKPLWVEQCSVYIKTAVSTGVCATSKHSTHRWLTLSN